MRWVVLTGLVIGVPGCERGVAPPLMRAQTIALFSTPKIIADFDNPDSSAGAFLDAYAPLTSRAAKTVLILAVGNSDHILRYRGSQYWNDAIDWARYTDGLRTDSRDMNYHQVQKIIAAFRGAAAERGITLSIYDQVDQGVEFAHEHFKLTFHPECFSMPWESFDIRGRLVADSAIYATAPHGTVAGKQCGEFLVDQVGAYLGDLGFDGILYGNQLGTLGRWLPENGPGYNVDEEAAIRAFFTYSRQVLGTRELMWFDSYNNPDIESASWSVPADGYASFDYIMAAGFCVITYTSRYLDNLVRKLALPSRGRVLATLDYVDPWYTYNSMTSYPSESALLEQAAIAYRFQVDGLVFFANDQHGAPVPLHIIESFAERYFERTEAP